MNMVDPLARARGHGSARGGTGHWFQQRASALILTPLLIWFTYAILTLASASYAEAVAFVSAPFNAGAFILLVISVLYHAMLGLQVVIEDYVHQPGLEFGLQLVVKGLAYLQEHCTSYGIHSFRPVQRDFYYAIFLFINDSLIICHFLPLDFSVSQVYFLFLVKSFKADQILS